MNRLYQNDLNTLSNKGLQRLIGIDEAGRGALAGPVVIAAVILDYAFVFEELKDSKLLSAKKRESLYQKITQHAYAYKIVEIEAELIDQINIRQATLLGFCKAYEALRSVASYALVDGRDLPDSIQGEAIVKGDSNFACIAAASILAKVHRDQIMRELDPIYPEYGFATHKGYGTYQHYEALHSYGACLEHRRSFRLK
ncbi:MAG: ribonuclease [Candidatus Cloacimonadota bacterium]|nr:ribonuclease [Candidatus Cloacimonadota bacterium]